MGAASGIILHTPFKAVHEFLNDAKQRLLAASTVQAMLAKKMRFDMKTPSSVFLFILLTVGGLPLPLDSAASQTFRSTGHTPHKTCYRGNSWTCRVEAAIVKETNILRRSHALVQNFETSYVARQWSREQATTEVISHEGFPDARQQTLDTSFPGYRVFFRAENVAMRRGYDESPEELAASFVKMWYESPGHRINMLGDYRYLGAGVIRQGEAIYATQLFH